MAEVGIGSIPIVPDFKPFYAGLSAQSATMGSKFKAIGALAGKSFVVATVVAVAGLAKLGSSFDKAFDTIRVGTGATGSALKGLEGDFKNVLKGVPTDFGSAATAVADLNTRLGLTGKPLQDRSKQFLELSRITKTDLGGNIQSVTRLFGDWGVQANEQSGTMDKLFRASQATGIGVTELANGMVKFGAPLRQLGFSFDESAGLLAKFEKEGVNAELVMGSLRIALGKMARDGEPAQETLQRVTEQIKNAGSASEANAIALELFGARAGPDMAAAIREGRFELGDLLTTIESGSETILSAAKDTRSFGESWTILKNNVFVALEPIATRLFSALTDGMVWLVDKGLPKIQDFVQNGLGAVTKWWADNKTTIVTAAETLRDGIKKAIDKIVDAVRFVVDEWDKFKVAIIAGVALMTPHWVALATAAVVSSATQVAAWVATKVEAAAAAVVHSVQVGIMIAKWVAHAAAATLNAAVVVAGWVAIAAAALARTVVAVAQFAIQVAQWIAMGVVATAQAAVVVAGWVAIGVAAVARTVVAVVQFGIQVAQWIAMGIAATAQALVIAAAWVISMGPIGLVVIAVVGLATVFVKNWETIRTAVLTGVTFVVDMFLEMAADVVGAAASAFSWVPGIGDQLKDAEEAVRQFKDDVNARLTEIKDRTVVVKFELSGSDKLQQGIEEATRRAIAGRGDGPGRPAGGLKGGNTLARVKSALSAGTYVTSTYRSPADNARVGGSPRSYHMDRANPAVDIGGSTAALNVMAGKLRVMGGWRELLWKVKGHYDHIHVAHSGGYVTPQGIAPLRRDELMTKLQVGETVLPKGSQGQSFDPVAMGRVVADVAESILRQRMRAA